MKTMFDNKALKLAIASGLMMALLLSGCKTNREEPTPVPKPVPEEKEEEPSTSKVTITTEIYNLVNGKLVPVHKTRAELQDRGTLSGGGEYSHGDKVTIKAEINDFLADKLVALYEKDGKGGFSKERGDASAMVGNPLYTVRDGVSSEVSFEAKEDMTFMAIFEEYQQPPFEVVNIYDHDYWVNANRLNMAEVSRNLVTDEAEVLAMMEKEGILTADGKWLAERLIERTVYRYAPTTLVYSTANPNDPRLHTDFSTAYRTALALADVNSKQILEVYPMSYDSYGSPTSHTSYCYVTLPPGKYRVVLLVNLPQNRSVWYQLPMVDKVEEGEAFFSKGLFAPYKPIPDNKSWRKDTDIVEVIDRQHSVVDTPVFTWFKVVKAEPLYRDSPNLTIDVRLKNVTNQRLRGHLVVCDQYKAWWHDNGRDWLEQIVTSFNNNRGTNPERADSPYNYWRKERARVEVSLLPREEIDLPNIFVDRKGEIMENKRVHMTFDANYLQSALYWEDENGTMTLIQNAREYEAKVARDSDWGNPNVHIWDFRFHDEKQANINIYETKTGKLYWTKESKGRLTHGVNGDRVSHYEVGWLD